MNKTAIGRAIKVGDAFIMPIELLSLEGDTSFGRVAVGCGSREYLGVLVSTTTGRSVFDARGRPVDLSSLIEAEPASSCWTALQKILGGAMHLMSKVS